MLCRFFFFSHAPTKNKKHKLRLGEGHEKLLQATSSQPFARQIRMRGAAIAVLAVLCAGAGAGASANGADNADNACQVHAAEACLEPGASWAQGSCHAVYGGFRGNTNGLHRIMLEHFQDSFRFLVMVRKNTCKELLLNLLVLNDC